MRKDKLQKLILGLMKKYNLDNKVGLFEGDSFTEPGENLPTINWTRKTLDNNGILIETPC